jgi:RND family efflux transporter MFP subunit
MKTGNILFFVVLAFLVSCQQGDDRDSIKKQISEYKFQVEELNKKIAALEKQLDSIPSAGEEGYRVAVEVVELNYSEFKHFIEVGGVVEAVNEAFISPEVSGQIQKIHVNEGQRVNAGQLLVTINSDIIQSQIDEVQSSLDYARVVYEKQKRLWDQGIGSEIQYLSAKNNVESLEKRMEILKTQSQMTRITSPVNGIVDEIYRKEGELAMPGVQLMQVVNLEEVFINADVPETYLSSIRVGDKVELAFPAFPELKMEVPIHRKGNVINPDNRTFTVQLKLANPDKKLKPNILARIFINDYTSESAVTVPASLIKQDLTGSYVYVIDEQEGRQVARKAYIETGLSYDNSTMVTHGIEPGQKIIVSGYNQVADGTAVEIQSDNVS